MTWINTCNRYFLFRITHVTKEDPTELNPLPSLLCGISCCRRAKSHNANTKRATKRHVSHSFSSNPKRPDAGVSLLSQRSPLVGPSITELERPAPNNEGWWTARDASASKRTDRYGMFPTEELYPEPSDCSAPSAGGGPITNSCLGHEWVTTSNGHEKHEEENKPAAWFS